jgi:hypothetical protein
MKATLVSDLLTPCAPLDYVQALTSGLEVLTGKTPSAATVAVFWAQSALESGRWRSMHRFNPGNIKAGPNYEYLYCQFRCNEVIGGKIEWFDPPNPQCNFRAFMDLEPGVIDYLRFIQARHSWASAMAGDPEMFVHVLKTQDHYFTADETPYLRGVASLFHECLKLIAAEPHEPADVDHAAAVAVVATTDDRLLHTQAVLMASEYDPHGSAGDAEDYERTP